MAAPVAEYPPLEQRPIANTICLFDVDDTLTIPRRVCFSATSLQFLIPFSQLSLNLRVIKLIRVPRE